MIGERARSPRRISPPGAPTWSRASATGPATALRAHAALAQPADKGAVRELADR
ncbi:hypothetical protein [Nonomuraea sp. NPDC049709]|uniref:hypothetical protein n=1 Tax=Nonomuraea sp. NPDC049709 TaxID=3154736 RepID=UPI003431E1B5